MTSRLFEQESSTTVWFRKEQGRFLKKARQRAGLSVKDVARKTGVDIRWVESGEVNLQGMNLMYLIQLYRVPQDYFMTWESFVRLKLQQMPRPKRRAPLHFVH